MWKKYIWILPVIGGFLLISVGINSLLHVVQQRKGQPMGIIHQHPQANDTLINLPSPRLTGPMSVEESLQKRRSVRSFKDTPLSLEEVSQVLWAAYGISDSLTFSRIKLKTTPSAGATYPLEIYLMAGRVRGIQPGVYQYHPDKHAIHLISSGDIREEVAGACLDQKMLRMAPASIIYAADYQRTVSRYGQRGADRYVCMDIGHSAQNVYLQATAMGLGTCAVGAFDDEKLSSVLQPPAEEKLLYLMPIGHQK